MDANAYILIALAAGAALGALTLALTSLHASRLVEALFDSLECALAERRQRRLEFRSDDRSRREAEVGGQSTEVVETLPALAASR
ncbi:MAG TPA: hypothetical protein VGV38_12370 [Pyrinomonadaceae bacterium]|nr:hypothetical protein [Pyrinomonadaceae bacterium]